MAKKKRKQPGIPGSGKNPWARLRKFQQSLTGSNNSKNAELSLSPDMRELEPRILYSAAPIGDFSMDVEGANELLDQDFFQAVDQQIEAVDIWSAADLESDTILISADDFASAADDFASESPQNTEIVFLDSNVEDFESLYQSLFDDAATGDKFEVHVLDANQDGIQQISQILDNRSDVSGVHIVSHGSDGSVQLGNTFLNSNNLSAYAASVASWSDALSSDADILFYGCDLASSTQGEEFIESISELTGADVAASDDLTGNAALGGDWEFEYVFGYVDTEIVFGVDVQANWQGLLATYEVTTTTDVVDGGDGLLSLREAVTAANANAGADTINFQGSGAFTHTLALGSLTLTDDVAITGAGVGVTVIDGDDLSRVFSVISGTVTMSDLTIQDGSAGNGAGLAISSGADVTLINVEMIGNTATTGHGGAIGNNGTLTLIDVTLDSNTAATQGGGLYNTGTATLTGVTISNNISNTAGGGIYTTGGGSNLNLTNVTISGNTATGGSGGGLYAAQNATLTNVTITDNTASSGGGIHFIGVGIATVTNSIIAENIDFNDGNDPDLSGGTYTSGRANLIGDLGSASGFTDGVDGDQVGDGANPIDPLLGALADNGGPTQTHALLAGSTAINAAHHVQAPLTDQLGNTRDGSADIGAFEFGAGIDTAPTQVNNNGSTVTEGATYTITNTELRFDDSEQPASSVTYSVTTSPTNGQLELTTNPGVAITSFTQAQIDANQVVYVHDGSETTSDEFKFDVDDGQGNTSLGQFVTGINNDTNLTNDANNDREPTWSPDGTQVAFRSNRHGNDEIYVMNADGTGVTRLTNNSDWDGRPSWSPDGSQIVFGSDRDGTDQIYVMNADGTGQTPLSNNLDNDTAPSWSPDGTQIIFKSDRDGNTQIYAMDTNGTNQINLSNNAFNESGATWSPDGTNIVFVSDRDGNSQVYVMNADGSGQTRITNTSDNETNPGWSPDGNHIVFKSDRDGNNEIYIMRADGTLQTNLTNDAANDGNPEWSPDGSQILFQTARDGNHEIYVADVLHENRFAVTVTAVNDTPVESAIEGTNLAYTENDAATQITNTIAIGDVDDTNIESAVVQVTGNYVNGQDVLAFANTGTITGVWNAVAGTMTLTGSDTLANYESALRSVTYENTSDDPSALMRTVSFTVNDGDVDSNTLTRNIEVTKSNDAPIITGGPDSTGLTETNSGLTDSGTLTVSDVDVTDFVTVAVDSVAVNGTGAGSVPGSLTNAILQSFLNVSPAAILDGTETTDTLTWDFNSGAEAFDFLATGETLVLTYTVSATDDDGTPLSDTETVTVTITGTDDAPTDLTTTSTETGGLNLNDDGGNDTYFVADDGGGLLGGLTTVTIEASFSISTPGPDLSPLLSYAEGSNDEELALFLKSDGRIWFATSTNGAAIQSTAGTYAQLFDGEIHHVAVSWDSTTGAVEFYVDGASVESFTGYQTGQSVGSTGELVFGQDQDSELGGFRTIDVFSGTLYDIRIFDDIRTVGEISTNYDQTLPNTEPGMIANWTFNDMSTGGVITDSVSGNNLTEQHVSGPGFTASDAELSLTVNEDAPDTTVIGNVSAIDADAGDTFTYTLTDDAGGRFAISAGGEITVANAFLIDFESATSHNITIEVTDSASNTYSEVFTIFVTNVNEAPVLDGLPILNLDPIAEDSGAPIGAVGTLVSSLVDLAGGGGLDNVTDPDAGALAGIAVTQAATGMGTWYYSIDNGTNWNLLVGATNNNALLLTADGGTRLYFEPNPDFNGLAVNPLQFRAWDQTSGTNGIFADASINGGTSAFSSVVEFVSVPVTAVNDAPLLDNTGTPTLTTIYENESTNPGDLIADIIASVGDPITDPDVGAVEGIAVTGVDDSNGTWEYSTNGGGSWTAFGSVSDASAALLGDSPTDRIRFVSDTNYNGTSSFTFRAWDRTDSNASGTTGINVTGNGGTSAYSSDTESAEVTILPIDVVLYLSTKGDVTNSGAAGLDDWTAGELLGLGDPNLSFEPGQSDGTLISVFNLDDFASDGDAAMRGMHFVDGPITVGGIDLFNGDILMAVDNSDTFTGSDMVSISPGNKDVIVFRPDTVGDNTSGTFFILLDTFSSDSVTGLSLVESNTTMGDVTLNAGTLIFTENGRNDVLHYSAATAGAGSTSGVTSTLIQGDDISMGASGDNIVGLDLIENNLNHKGAKLDTGNILVSIENDDADVGDNNQTVLSSDVFILDVFTTTMGSGTTSADVGAFIEGSDLNLGTGSEKIDAIALNLDFFPSADPVLTLPGTDINYTENDPATLIDAAATLTDADASSFKFGQLSVDYTAGGTLNDRLAIKHVGSGAGQIGVVGSNVEYGGVKIGSFTGGDGINPLVVSFSPNADINSVQALIQSITYENVSEDPATISRAVRFVVTDGDGGTSTPTYTTINMTAINDAPTMATNMGMTVAEGSAGTNITSAMLNEGDPDDVGTGLIYTVTSVTTTGTLRLSGTALINGNTFTQEDIDFGRLTYDHNDAEVFVDSFSFSLADGGEDGSTPVVDTFTININPVNDNTPDAGLDFTANVAEESANGTAVGAVSASDVDLPGDTLTYSITAGDPLNGFAIDASGNITISDASALDLDFDDGSDLVATITVTVDDGTLSDTVDVTVRVTPVNDNTPDAGLDFSTTIAEESANTTFVGAVSASDVDLPGDTLTYSITAGDPLNGFAIDASGNITISDASALDLDFDDGSDLVATITVTVDDGTSSDTVDVTVRVTPINDNTPDAGLDFTTTVAEESANTTFVGTVSASDVDLPGDTLTYSITSGDPLNGFAIDASGNITISDASVLDLDFDDGSDLVATITVTVDDGSLNDTVDVTVRVTPINDNTPDAGLDFTTTVAEESANTTFVGTVSASDVDLPGDTLTYSITSGDPLNGFAIDASGNITISDASVLDLDFDDGSDLVATLTITVNDGTFSDTVDVTVRVTPINDNNPNAGLDFTTTVAEESANTTFVGAVSASDVDLPGDTLTYAITGGDPAGGFAIDASGNITINDASVLDLDFDDGSDLVATLTVTVDDGSLSDTVDVTVRVTPINETPDAGLDFTTTVAEESANTTFVGAVSASDVDLPGDTLTYAITAGDPLNGFAIDSSGNITVDDASVLDLDFDDGSDLAATLTITVDDGSLSDTVDVTVRVTPVNDNTPDAGVDFTTTVVEESTNGTFVGTVLASDIDLPGDVLTYSITGGDPLNGFAIDASGNITINDASVLDLDFDDGSDLVTVLTVTVDDGSLNDTVDVTVRVTPINDNTPNAGLDFTTTVAEESANTTFVGSVSASDVDLPGDTLTYSISAGDPLNGFAIDSFGNITISDASVLNLDFDDGSDLVATITVTVSDGTNTDTVDVTVRVTPVNDNTPDAGLDFTANVVEESANGTALGSISASDIDLPGDTLTYSITGGDPLNGFAVDASGNITINDASVLDLDFDDGSDLVATITVTVSDGTNTDTIDVTVRITPINETPDAGLDFATTVAEESVNTTFVGAVSATDVDLPGDTLTYSITGGDPLNGFTIDAAGNITISDASVLDLDFDDGSDLVATLTVTVDDGSLSDTVDVTVRVTPINETPDAGLDFATTVAEESANGTLVGTVSASDLDLPGDTLTYTITGGDPSSGFAIDASGNITISNAAALDLDFDDGSDLVATLTVTVDDGTFSDTVDVTVRVTPVNDITPNAGLDFTTTVAEESSNGTFVGTVSASDVDLPGDVLSYTITGGDPLNGFAIDSSGNITINDASVLDLDFDDGTNLVATITVTVDDGTFSDTADVTVRVTPTNDNTPNAGLDFTANVAEESPNTTFVGAVSASDVDLPGDMLTYAITGGDPLNGFAIDASGNITISDASVLDLDFDDGTDLVATITVTVSDGTNSDTIDVTVRATPINDNTPDAGLDFTANVAEESANGTAVGTISASDVDLPGDVLTYSITGGDPLNGFVIDSSGNITINDASVLNLDFDDGSDLVATLTITVDDGTFSDAVDVTVRVTPINDNSPDAGLDFTANVAEESANGTAVGTISASDVDLPGDTLTYSITAGDPLNGFAVDASGNITISDASVLDLDFDDGTDLVATLTVTVSDGTNSDTIDVTVRVTPVNDNAPAFTSPSAVNLAENNTAVMTVNAIDTDLPGQTVTYSITGGLDAALFSIDANTGQLTFNAAPDYETPADNNGDNVYEVEVTANDNVSLTTAQSILVTVTPANESAPVFTTPGTVNVAENNAAVMTVNATDADVPVQTVTYSITGGLDGTLFSIDANTGELTFDAAPDYETPADNNGDNVYEVEVTANDNVSLTTAQTILVSVTPVNDNSPNAGLDFTATITEESANTTFVGAVSASDVDLPGDTLTYAITGGDPLNGFVIDASGNITINDASVLDVDFDDGNDLVAVLTITVDDGTFSDTVDVTVRVTPVNDNTPNAGLDFTTTVAEESPNTTFVGTVSASDVDLPGDTLTYAITAGDPSGGFTIDSSGNITINDASVLDLDFDDGSDLVATLTITVDDGTLSDTIDVTVHVTPVNDNTPNAGLDFTATIAEESPNTTFVGTVSASDVDLPGDTLTYAITAGDSLNGFAIDSSGNITISDASVLDLDFDDGTDLVANITVTVSDGTNSDTVDVTVRVTPINDNTPDAGLDFTANVAEESANGTAVGTISASDVDLPGDTLTYAITAGDPVGGFAVDASGNITISDASVLDLDFDDGSDLVATITVTVSDGTNSDTVDVTVRVTPINDNTPDAGLDFTANVAEESANGTTVGSISASDVDLPGDTLTYAITAGDPLNGFAVDASGNITISDASVLDLDFDDGTDLVANITVTVSDGTNSDTIDVTVRVTPVNDNTPDAGLDFTANVAEESANGTLVGTVSGSDLDLPGDTLTYAITAGDPLNGFAVDASGNITISDASVLDLDFDDGTDLVATITVTVSDGTNSDTIDVTVRVTPINDNVPAFTNPSAINLAENNTAVMTVNAIDTDLPGQTVTYSITGGLDAALFSIDASTGELTFNAAPDYETPADNNGDNVYEVQVTANDNVSLTTAQSILVTVTPANESAPVFTTPGTVNVAENNAAVMTVNATDADVPVQTVTYSITGGLDGTLFSIDANTGELTFDAAPDYETPADNNGDNVYEVEVTANDNVSLTTAQTILVSVTPVNDNSPNAGLDFTATITEESANTTFVGAVSASDVDLPGDTLTYAITGGDPLNGFVIDASGNITINDASVLDVDFDDGNDLVATLTVTVSDGTNSDTVDVTVRVTPVNDNTPDAGLDFTANVAEESANGTAVGTISASDVDLPGDTLTYAITAGDLAGGFAVDASGNITISDASVLDLDFDDGSDLVATITVTVSDGTNSDTVDVTVRVTPVNDNTPNAGLDFTTTVAEESPNGTLVGTVSGSDLDLPGDTLTFSITAGDPSSGFAIDASGNITISNAAVLDLDFDDGTDLVTTLTITVDDGSLSDTVDVAVRVTPINDNTPDAGLDFSVNVAEESTNGTLVGVVSASDIDLPGDTLSYAITGGDPLSGFSVDASANITITNASVLDLDFDDGTDLVTTLTITVDDGTFNDTVDVTVRITPINDNTPDAGLDFSVNVAEESTNGTLVGSVSASDIDLPGDTLSYAITGGDPLNGFSVDASGNITITDASALDLDFDDGTDLVTTLTITVDDGSLSDTVDVTVRVTPVNEGPVLANAGTTLDEGSTEIIDVTELNAVDVDNLPAQLVYTVTTTPTNGFLAMAGPTVPVFTFSQADIDSGQLIYVHDGSETTGDQFFFDLTDGANTIFGQRFDLNVTPVNDAPVSNFDSDSVNEDQILNGSSVLANDSDVDSAILTAQLVSGPANADLFVLNSDGTFTYTPTADYFGTDSFQYQASDGAAVSATTTVTINVNSVNDLPQGHADSYVAIGNEALTELASVLANDGDVENDALVAILVSNPANGNVRLAADGTFVYTPDSGFIGSDSFTYMPNDGSGNGTLTTVTIEVDAPGGGPPDGRDDGDGDDGGKKGNDDPDDDNDTDPAVDGFQLPTPRDISGDTADDRPGSSKNLKSLDLDNLLGGEISKQNLPDQQQATDILEWMVAQQAARDNASDNDDASARVSGITFAFNASQLWEELDRLADEVAGNLTFDINSTTTIAITTITATAGYIIWSLRGGFLMATLVSSLPTWSHIDPLPVLESRVAVRNSRAIDATDRLFD